MRNLLSFFSWKISGIKNSLNSNLKKKVRIFSVHSLTLCPGKNSMLVLSRRGCPVKIKILRSLDGQCCCQRPLPSV